MSPTKNNQGRVGQLRPSQLLFSFGIGASVDLPHITTLVLGLDFWPIEQMSGSQISEERLRLAIRRKTGAPIEFLMRPPHSQEGHLSFGQTPEMGVPVATFPRWLRCSKCNRLGQLQGSEFKLDTRSARPENAKYVHVACGKSKFNPPALPVRFVLGCENGHLDDLPWISYAHYGENCPRVEGPALALTESGTAGDASSIFINCFCGAKRPLSDAFRPEFGKKGARTGLGCACRGRHPHLGHFFEPCEAEVKTLVLGASNAWFPLTMSVLSLPEAVDKLGQLVEENWVDLSDVEELRDVTRDRKKGRLNSFADFSDEAILASIEAKRAAAGTEPEAQDMKEPEWHAFSDPAKAKQGPDFRLREEAAPEGFEVYFERVVIAERLREVHAFVGFTRIESPLDFGEATDVPDERIVPICRDKEQMRWVPASEVRGEGIFLQLKEDLVRNWCQKPQIETQKQKWARAGADFRARRGVPDPETEPPHTRYALLHSLSHALMRQLCLDCGYSSASIRERIYCADPDENGEGAQAGILIYTAAPDSEGTLGGLVGLGAPKVLGAHLQNALQNLRICTNDPICSQHEIGAQGSELRGCACHACLFSPETSCERGNKFLDRGVLVETFDSTVTPFFASP